MPLPRITSRGPVWAPRGKLRSLFIGSYGRGFGVLLCLIHCIENLIRRLVAHYILDNSLYLWLCLWFPVSWTKMGWHGAHRWPSNQPLPLARTMPSQLFKHRRAGFPCLQEGPFQKNNFNVTYLLIFLVTANRSSLVWFGFFIHHPVQSQFTKLHRICGWHWIMAPR